MNDRPYRILIADDHPVFRFGLRSLIETQTDLVVVGEAEDGDEAVQMAAALAPDVVLMDINMPVVNGLEATQRITADASGVAVLIITMMEDETILSAMRAGARGYLIKGANGRETLRAIRAAANGEIIVSPGAAEQMMAFLARGAQTRQEVPFPDLTPREQEVLELIAKGFTNSAIAERLVLSPKTVRNHVSNIFGKLDVTTRSAAIVKAREAGLGNGS